MSGMTRMRTYGLITLVVMMGALAGCGGGGGGGGGGGTCGPGETAIGDLSSGGSLSTVKGTVRNVTSDGLIIDDGTGTAFVATSNTDFSSGDCVQVNGIPEEASEVDADIRISAVNVQSA